MEVTTGVCSGGEFQSEAQARLHLDKLPLRSVSWCHRLHDILDNTSVTVRFPDISCILYFHQSCIHTGHCSQSEKKTTRPKVNQVRKHLGENITESLTLF